MDVKILQQCERCGRKEEKTVSLEAAQKLSAEAESRKLAAGSVATILNTELKDPKYPEIIVALRSPGSESYIVKTLDGLCERPGAERNKGCKQRVVNLVSAIFTIETPKPKKDKPKKVETATPPNGDAKPKHPPQSKK